MRELSITAYTPEQVSTYLHKLTFFDHLSRHDAKQYDLLMQHTKILELEAGEVLIEKGTIGNIFYSLVHGQLAIFPDKRPGENAISELFPSQILGALSIINQLPRTATVMVSSVEGAIVFCTDFAVFGELQDFSRVSLRTKLLMFRDVVEKILTTLRKYEVESPDDILSQELQTLMSFAGEPNSAEELEHLAELAIGLAWLLDKWNKRVTPKVPVFDEKDVEKILRSVLKI